MKVTITHIDTACVLIEINGFKILTDPTLDEAGGLYHHGFGSLSRKTESPALHQAGIGHVDLVLLSHHQHKDNFDNKGQAFTAGVSQVLSTRAAARAHRYMTGLDDWETIAIATSAVPGLKITATPAQHHPSWVPEFLSGKVIGFVIEFEGQKNGVIYIAGDTVFFSGIIEVAKRFNVDIGIFHVGSAQFRYLTGFAQFTMDSSDLLKAIKVLCPNRIIPVHYKGWSHFKEKEGTLRNAIASNFDVSDRTVFLEPGVATLLY